MKPSERIRQTAKLKATSASIWDNWEVGGWNGLADEVEKLEADNAALKRENKALRANTSKSVLRRLDIQLEETE